MAFKPSMAVDLCMTYYAHARFDDHDHDELDAHFSTIADNSYRTNPNDFKNHVT